MYLRQSTRLGSCAIYHTPYTMAQSVPVFVEILVNSFRQSKQRVPGYDTESL